jgi:dihydroneopterin aldolase
MAGWMTVELKGLRFFAEHGMYAEEKKVGNEFEVGVSVIYKAPKRAITSIEDTVNYMEIYRIIEDEFKERKLLLETCAMLICEKVQQIFPGIKNISISIKKINPPITNFTGSVGVTFSKEFK